MQHRSAQLVQSVPVRETYDGETIWDGVVRQRQIRHRNQSAICRRPEVRKDPPHLFFAPIEESRSGRGQEVRIRKTARLRDSGKFFRLRNG
jgi:hypothetical protein